MLWVLAFHLIFMVAWFAGLFYLPRLFVYHAVTEDTLGLNRFNVMEHKLYYFIMTPSGILTSVFGLWLLTFNFNYYLHAKWMYVKLVMIVLLWLYHLYCGHLVGQFKKNANRFGHKFYRFFNEIPSILLIVTVIMAVVKP